ALSAVLILLARPAAVLTCLWPFRFSPREMVFLSWVGLRGAVSILLALVPLLAELPEGQRIFNTTFLIVVISLGIQGWTVRPLAHRLGLIVPRRTGPVERLELELPGLANHELVAYTIREDSPLVRGVRLPRWARPVLVQRQGQVLDARSARAPQAGDRVYLFTAPARLPLLDRLFGGAKALADDDPLLFGEFSLDPDSTLGAVAAVYGATIPADKASLTLAELFRLEFRDRPEIGDRIHLGSIDLIARDIEGDRLTAVGLAVDPRQRRRAGWLARLLRSYTL
ncbi:MAG: cation:proton antiporter, partial [Rhodospirillales bacterium]|nr:cation:proton antiporter [Rhodospirillales bacterium]